MQDILNTNTLQNVTLEQIQNDSTLMLMAGLALVVLLVIVLTIVVSTMRVKTHKDRFWEVLTDNKAKAENLVDLGQELQDLKIKDAKSEQELMQFVETKSRLKEATDMYVQLQQSAHNVENELSQIKAKLEASELMFENLTAEYKVLQGRHETVQEENVKCRTSNARLLMKLEQK
jgi:DNA recombination protein RmuC